MRKKTLILCLVSVLVFLIGPVQSEAGTYMLGVKGWYTTWESSVLDWFEQNLVLEFASLGRNIKASKDAGSGHLVGPLMSYQTDDGKWSASFAAMVFSSFKQDWEGAAAGMEMDADVGLDRIDFDLAVNYSLNKYISFFVGYKYQDMDMDFTLAYTTMMGDMTNKYKLESGVHIPTAGAGFVYPVSDKIALSAQLGLLYSIPDLIMTDNEGTRYDIWPRGGFGFNGEININYQPTENLIIQLGYRYQRFQMEARKPETWTKIGSDDITHGPTLSAVWVF